ncbi:hypothetical protein B0B52_17045 [Polaromonas sp. A23]|nr:hypothetical protein B0B52_17045 [Polaromonas sp. A23]
MLKVGSAAPVMMEIPVTTSPLDATLSSLTALAGRDIAKGKLRVFLSGALCPALGVSTPKEITQWKERHQIALASVAQTLSTDTNQVECGIDAFLPGVAAAISLATLEQLRLWAIKSHYSIVSIQPLWALATQCQAARQPGIKSLVLLEPDAVTLLASDELNRFTASTLPGQIDPSLLGTHTRRWQVSHGLTEDQVMKIGFDIKPGNVVPAYPKPWSSHWYKP